MGKAKIPHDSSRPESPGVTKALAADDMDALRDALTYRQRRYCEEYVIDFDGKAAAIRAGYSVKWPDRQAHLLHMNKGVVRYIDHLQMSKESKIVSINPEYLIQKLLDIMNRPGIRTADELRAVEMMMKHMGMFVDKTEISGPDGDAIKIEQKVQEDALKFRTIMEQLKSRQKKEIIID